MDNWIGACLSVAGIAMVLALAIPLFHHNARCQSESIEAMSFQVQSAPGNVRREAELRARNSCNAAHAVGTAVIKAVEH